MTVAATQNTTTLQARLNMFRFLIRDLRGEKIVRGLFTRETGTLLDRLQGGSKPRGWPSAENYPTWEKGGQGRISPMTGPCTEPTVYRRIATCAVCLRLACFIS